MKRIKVTVIGGGTGTFPVVTALKNLKIDISTVTAVSDSGGSTGRIRDEFGFPPVGDLRQSLAALAHPQGQQWIQKVLLYRFSKGSGLKGHNLGNLILTALQDMTGSTTKSLEIAEKIFHLSGKVIPVTTSNINLKIHYQDGSSEVGEHILDKEVTNPKKIKKVSLVPQCRLNPVAKDAIINAEYIIIGPGDHYASILSSLIADGTKEAFASSQAKVIYIVNLMTRRTQTHKMSINDHLQEIEQAIDKKVNYLLINNSTIPKDILDIYAHSQEFPVKNDLKNDDRIVMADLLLNKTVLKNKYDTAHRSFLRHDAQKLAKVLKKILK